MVAFGPVFAVPAGSQPRERRSVQGGTASATKEDGRDDSGLTTSSTVSTVTAETTTKPDANVSSPLCISK